MLALHARLRSSIQAALAARFGLEPEAVPPIAIEVPPNRALGDLATPAAFELARILRRAPRQIAEAVVEAIGTPEGIAATEVAANGYINFYLDRAAFVRAAAGTSKDPAGAVDVAKVIVEHTAINPNKSAHVGHLRNAALGDTLVRLLRFRGRPVEVQNYIDDTGVQVADIVVGFRQLEARSLEEVRKLAASAGFDAYCWDLYAQVTAWYKADPAREALRSATLHDLEQGDTAAAEFAEVITDRIVRCHLATMARINVDYDLLSWEGDILRLDFWTTAFAILREAGAVFRPTEGPQAGCWVMAIDDEPAAPASDDGTPDESRLKVIVRSNGTVTYVGKDIAYQCWKFGLLDRDFDYRPFGTTPAGRVLWSTTSDPQAAAGQEAPAFGRAKAVYNVIDARQSYLQQLLAQALARLGHTAAAERSVHFSYEMVALSPRTAVALGYDSAETADRRFVEVSGRKGLGVKADDLLDRLTEAAAREVAARNSTFDTAETARIAAMIAAAAVRYFMIKYSRGTVIAFDIDEALSFEGESGPYLQYAAVRAANILQKLEAETGLAAPGIAAALANLDSAPLAHPEGTELWALVLEAARLEEVAEHAIRTLELSVLAKYAFGLAQAFNAFYHRAPVVREPDPAVRTWRAAAVLVFHTGITRALDLMGCDVPPRM